MNEYPNLQFFSCLLAIRRLKSLSNENVWVFSEADQSWKVQFSLSFHKLVAFFGPNNVRLQ